MVPWLCRWGGEGPRPLNLVALLVTFRPPWVPSARRNPERDSHLLLRHVALRRGTPARPPSSPRHGRPVHTRSSRRLWTGGYVHGDGGPRQPGAGSLSGGGLQNGSGARPTLAKAPYEAHRPGPKLTQANEDPARASRDRQAALLAELSVFDARERGALTNAVSFWPSQNTNAATSGVCVRNGMDGHAEFSGPEGFS
jgi:hypothetical protein